MAKHCPNKNRNPFRAAAIQATSQQEQLPNPSPNAHPNPSTNPQMNPDLNANPNAHMDFVYGNGGGGGIGSRPSGGQGQSGNA
jgi:hypothetical protein